jgi:hypothetical protein
MRQHPFHPFHRFDENEILFGFIIISTRQLPASCSSTIRLSAHPRSNQLPLEHLKFVRIGKGMPQCLRRYKWSQSRVCLADLPEH